LIFLIAISKTAPHHIEVWRSHFHTKKKPSSVVKSISKRSAVTTIIVIWFASWFYMGFPCVPRAAAVAVFSKHIRQRREKRKKNILARNSLSTHSICVCVCHCCQANRRNKKTYKIVVYLCVSFPNPSQTHKFCCCCCCCCLAADRGAKQNTCPALWEIRCVATLARAKRNQTVRTKILRAIPVYTYNNFKFNCRIYILLLF